MPELRTEIDCDVVLAPVSDRDSRPETDRRDVEERDEAREDRELLRTDELLRPLPSGPSPAEAPAPVPERLAATTGARPQVSQYSSPPPMSS
ncbi:hypothetical protein [Streptomyces albipurpureus]|uniref:hypothetical protein n=1 Tax=Streptomyces albipurpureus TaxID=2897419 RepID=UPI003CE54DF7